MDEGNRSEGKNFLFYVLAVKDRENAVKDINKAVVAHNDGSNIKLSVDDFPLVLFKAMGNQGENGVTAKEVVNKIKDEDYVIQETTHSVNQIQVIMQVDRGNIYVIFQIYFHQGNDVFYVRKIGN